MICQLQMSGGKPVLASNDHGLSQLASGVIAKVEEHFQHYGLDEFRQSPQEGSFYQNEGLRGIHWTTVPEATDKQAPPQPGSSVFQGVKSYESYVAGLGSEFLSYRRNGSTEVFGRALNGGSSLTEVVCHHDRGLVDVRI